MANIDFVFTNLETLNLKQLQTLAKEHQVKNWWTMKKANLLEALTLIQNELKDEEHLTEEDVEELVEQAQEELGLNKEVPWEETPLIPMPGTQDPNWGEKAAGKTTGKAEAPKTPKVEKDQDNLVTIKELAAEFHMKGTKARRLLRNEEALRPYGSNRWEWDKVLHKDELDKVRKILEAHTK